MQQEVECAEVGELEAFHFAFDEIAEVPLDAFGGDFADEDWVMAFVIGDYSDIAGVSLVAGTGMCDLAKAGFHRAIVALAACGSLRSRIGMIADTAGLGDCATYTNG